MNAYSAIKPLLFQLPAETVHNTATTLLETVQDTPAERALASFYQVEDERLSVDAFGQTFPNPVGVAAGFDKNGEIAAVLASLGFGSVEVGAVTAEAQPGNPRPRLFRLPEDEALVNRMGFNNEGADRISERLARKRLPDVPVGVNIGKSKVTPLAEAAGDYEYTYERVADHGDFFVVNVSSPNTPGLRKLQARDALEGILGRLLDALPSAPGTPFLQRTLGV